MEYSMLYMATLDDIAIKAMQGMLASGQQDRIVITRNAWAMAKQMILEREIIREELVAKKKQLDEEAKFDKRPIYGNLHLSLRILNSLRAEEIDAIGQLTCRTVRDLQKFPNLGMKGIKQIQEELAGLGLALKGAT